MPADTPEEVHELFTKYFSAGDLDAVMSLYEPGATIVQRDTSVTGHAAIRQALSGFLALKGEFALQLRKTFQSDDIALLFSFRHIKPPEEMKHDPVPAARLDAARTGSSR